MFELFYMIVLLFLYIDKKCPFIRFYPNQVGIFLSILFGMTLLIDILYIAYRKYILKTM